MATRHIFKHLGAGASLLILAGCGGGSSIVGDGGGGTPSEPPRAIAYADEAGTASAALAGGLEASPLTTAAVTNDYPAGTSAQRGETAFALRRNDQGGVDLTVDGETTSFAASGGTGYGWVQQEGANWRELASWQGSEEDVLNDVSGEYSQMWQYFLYDDSTGLETAGHAVIGTETRPSVLTAKASATYRGYMTARSFGADDPTRSVEYQAGTNAGRELAGGREGSRVLMTADFDASTIAGDVTGIVARTRGAGGAITSPFEALPGRVVMEEAQIVGNGYQGRLTAVDGFPEDLGTDASYSGRFYGPNAEETAGVLSIPGETETASGAYRAFEY